MFVDENYDGNITKLYNEYNLTSFRNHNQGLSFENFVTFLENNYKLLESYHIKDNQKKSYLITLLKIRSLSLWMI